MSSAEIKAQIAELMAALADFEGQVAQVIANYHNTLSKVSSINSVIGYSQDTLTIKGIYNTNTKIIGKVSKLIAEIESAKGKVSSGVNKEIEDLEAALKVALAKEAIARQKKLHNANIEQLY